MPYASQFGHRGFSHSLFMAVVVALILTLFAKRLGASRQWVFGFIAVAMASHPLLDALTNGGLGVALWWPWSDERFFFPLTPIQVSPIGRAFFSERGLAVLLSELGTIWLPCLVLGLMIYKVRRNLTQRNTQA
ncbi:metal-dependent hydrolase [Chitinimonas sp. DQS-5]|uniref:Metal-dependent hydrolase n=1 Tax=Parachitinimonas caeni TaxID=3031301 RepID=A0ABT7E1A1_9NEIS|nr:metal-dependent hydrolase [Parachitinimonas caeni]